MKAIIGFLLIILGLFLGVYVGIIKCFIGGIAEIIDLIKSPDAISGVAVGWAIGKIFFANFFGWLSAIIPMLLGKAFLESQ